jgi:excisionase family DNA binding protein
MPREPEQRYGETYFTYEEAAEHLNCGLYLIQEKVQAGEIPVVLLGHKTRRIRRRDLDRWADSLVQPASARREEAPRTSAQGEEVPPRATRRTTRTRARP